MTSMSASNVIETVFCFATKSDIVLRMRVASSACARAGADDNAIVRTTAIEGISQPRNRRPNLASAYGLICTLHGFTSGSTCIAGLISCGLASVDCTAAAPQHLSFSVANWFQLLDRRTPIERHPDVGAACAVLSLGAVRTVARC